MNMVLGADGAIAYESAAVERVLGFRAADRIGTSVLDGAHPDDLAWGQQLLADVTRAPARSTARSCSK